MKVRLENWDKLLENWSRQPDAHVDMPAAPITTVSTPAIKLTQPAPVPAPPPASSSAKPVQAPVPKAPAVSIGKGPVSTTGVSVPAIGPSILSGATSGEGLQPKTVPVRTHKNDEAQSRVKPEEEHQAIRAAERSKLISFLAQHATEIDTDGGYVCFSITGPKTCSAPTRFCLVFVSQPERAGTAHTLLRVFKNHQVMWNLLLKVSLGDIVR